MQVLLEVEMYLNNRADSLKDDLSLPRRSKPVFDKTDLGQTNMANSELNEKVDSNQTGLKLIFTLQQ
jgi:hypothetical protein